MPNNQPPKGSVYSNYATLFIADLLKTWFYYKGGPVGTAATGNTQVTHR